MPDRITNRALAGRPDDALTASIAAFARALDAGDPFVAVFRHTYTPMAISDPTLPDNPIIYVNAAFEALTGFPPQEVIGRNCRFLQGPTTDPDDVASLRAAIAAREAITVDLLNHRRDGTAFWNRLMVAPVFDPVGNPRYYVASQADVTVERERLATLEAEQQLLYAEAEQARADLVDAQRRLDLAAIVGAYGTWSLDPATERLDSSPGCKAIFGREPDEAFDYDDFKTALHPEDRARVTAAIEATLAGERPYDIEYRIVVPDGAVRWVAVKGELLRRRDGSPLTMSGIVTDITDKVTAEEQRQVVARELSHRVKNTLAIVNAIVGQTLRHARSMDEARTAVSGRLASLATAHGMLMDEGERTADLSEVAHSALAPFAGGTTRFVVEGPRVRLDADCTLAVSMTLHELATNAAKYGALSRDGGEVAIRWSPRAPEEGVSGTVVDLDWIESGGPRVEPPVREGFGSQMMRRVLGRHLVGTVAPDYAPEGLRLRLGIRTGQP